MDAEGRQADGAGLVRHLARTLHIPSMFKTVQSCYKRSQMNNNNTNKD